MKEINEIKNRIRNKSEKNFKSKLKIFFIKLILIIILLLLVTLISLKNPRIKNIIYQKMYNSNISFANIKKIYNKKIGNVLPFGNIFYEKKVFSEKLRYKSSSKYNKGVKLILEDNYLIPAIKGGIVIFIGKKNNMDTVIIQQSNKIDVMYSNLKNKNVKLYDYVEDNQIIGEANDNILYLTFQKDGVEIDYKDVIK